MGNTLQQVERIQSEPVQASLFKDVAQIPGIDRIPKVVITGDLRLRISESRARRSMVYGHYDLETEGMRGPLHVIWTAEANVLNHTVNAIDVAFDVRGTPAGETLTRLLTAQVTESNGQGRIVHTSVFVQIFVVKDDLTTKDLMLKNVSL